MPDYPQLAYLSVQELIGAAGGDPWQVDDTLQAGAPGETGGMPWEEFGTRFGTPETRIYPENRGFPPGYEPQPAQLPVDTVIDRFGSVYGHYLSPDGAPFSDRALAPESVGGDYNRYVVAGKPLPPGWRIVEGPVQPFYGQIPSPGATQYMIEAPDGVRPTVDELVRAGILGEYGPVLGQ